MSDQQPRAAGYKPTTTHAEWGSGHPHLIISRDGDHQVFHLKEEVVHIGSSDDNQVQLPDIDALHASIVHDERDEYVLTMHGPGEMNAVSHARPGEERVEILRTGARFTADGWTFVFSREEFADHGRPYGGREGGELSDQSAQPARPDYRHGEARPSDGEYEVKDG